MKNIFLKITFCCALVLSISLNLKAQTSIITQLSNLNLNSFLGKPIDSFIAKIPIGYTDIAVIPGGDIFLAGGIIISYPNNIDINIFAKDFQYVVRYNSNHIPSAQAWPINLMRKEKIDVITIYRNWNIINSAGE